MDLHNLTLMEMFFLSSMVILVPGIYLFAPWERISRIIPFRLWLWTILGSIAGPIAQAVSLTSLEAHQAEQVGSAIGAILASLWIITTAITLKRFASFGIDHVGEKNNLPTRLGHIGKILIRYIIFALAALMVLEQWGFEPTGVIAGLGVISLGIALASQSTVSNIFGFGNISVNHPFFEGDEITAAGISGTVKRIAVAHTTLIQDNGDETIVPNKHFIDAIVTNHSRKDSISLEVSTSFSPTTSISSLNTLFADVVDPLFSYGGADCHYWTVNKIGDSIDVIVHYSMDKDSNAEDINKARSSILMRIATIAQAMGVELSGITTEEVIFCGNDESCTQDCGQSLSTSEGSEVIEDSENGEGDAGKHEEASDGKNNR